MKRVLILLVVLIGLSLATLPMFSGGHGHAQNATKGKFRRTQKAIANSYIVVFKDDVSRDEVPSLASQLALAHGAVPKHV